MTAIQDWASSVCALGIGCAVLKMLCPAGAMRRVFGVLTAVIFVCCLLSPFTTMLESVKDLFAIPRTASPSYELSDAVNEQAVAVIEEALLVDARSRLQDTADVKSVTVIRDTMREDSIYIKRVLVTVDGEDHASSFKIRATLQSAWGVDVEVNDNG